MRATGIVRRIDDLGRVVVPKEIRQSLRIREGDPLELWLDGDVICFKKYNALSPFEDNLKSVIEMLKDEDVSRRLSEEDKTLITAAVNAIIKKWNDSEGE